MNSNFLKQVDLKIRYAKEMIYNQQISEDPIKKYQYNTIKNILLSNSQKYKVYVILKDVDSYGIYFNYLNCNYEVANDFIGNFTFNF